MSFLKMTGVHIPHYKNTADCVPVRLPVPDVVTIPMSMHIGAPARAVVKAGDKVNVGQLIGEPGGFVSAPVHSSVSGTVKRVGSLLVSSGNQVQSVVIETDKKQEVWEGIAPPQVTDLQSFLDAVRASGAVGLGGAGFPTSVKLSVKDLSRIEAVIINGAECEPYITSDTRTMLDDADYIMQGIEYLQKYLQAKRIIVAIESNKPRCIRLYKERCAGRQGIEVHKLPSTYPQGGEKVLIYNTTGRIVPEGKLPIDAGAIVINCTTLAFIAKYIETGMPLVEKCVTVDGSAIQKPRNVIAPIGTPLRSLLQFCEVEDEPVKLLYGGPMMGIAVPDPDQPVLKNTNAITALDEKDAVPPESTACIKCGRCVAHCPMRLMPAMIENAYNHKNDEALEQLKVNLCMECGCCSYVCPAKRHLVMVNKLAKGRLRKYQAAKKAEAERKAAAAEEAKAK